jgi:hypothetical protein
MPAIAGATAGGRRVPFIAVGSWVAASAVAADPNGRRTIGKRFHAEKELTSMPAQSLMAVLAHQTMNPVGALAKYAGGGVDVFLLTPARRRRSLPRLSSR